MELHLGRVVDHVHLRVRDLEWSRRFYQSALGALGRELRTGDGYFSCDELWVTADGPPTENLHLAFQAADEESVRRFHMAAVAAGGRDNGGRASATTIRATTRPTSSIRMASCKH